jgi:hypothetical protein
MRLTIRVIAINIMEPVKASLTLGEQKTFVNKNNISEQQIANCFQKEKHSPIYIYYLKSFVTSYKMSSLITKTTILLRFFFFISNVVYKKPKRA